MQRTKRKVLVDRLPSTPCTTEMRERMVGLAEKQGVSIADIQRNAYALFLSCSDTKCIAGDRKISEESEVES